MEAYVLLISGRVQGVGFRWFAEREAQSRDVRGYARNLEDGRVEVLVQGDPDTLQTFFETLYRGPLGSRVEDIQKMAVEVDEALPRFHVRF